MYECKEFCDMLSDYIDGETDEHECLLIEEHLKMCPPCAEFFKSLSQTVKLCGCALSDEIPDEVRLKLKQFLRMHCGRKGEDSCSFPGNT